MIFKEFGNDNKDVIILLHGGGLSWWNYKGVIELLKTDYHIILPVLNGHPGSDKSFINIEDNANEIINFIDEKLNGKIKLIGGLSLGGQILLEILSKRNEICEYALIESANVIPSKFTNKLISPMINSSYALIKNKTFSKLQFDSLHINKELFDDYYKDTCLIKKEDMISFLKASTSYKLKESIKNTKTKTFIYIGEKENKTIKDSADIINKTIPNSIKTIIPNLYHGEFSINNPILYVQEIDKILNNWR